MNVENVSNSYLLMTTNMVIKSRKEIIIGKGANEEQLNNSFKRSNLQHGIFRYMSNKVSLSHRKQNITLLMYAQPLYLADFEVTVVHVYLKHQRFHTKYEYNDNLIIT